MIDWIRIEDRATWVVEEFEKINPANEFKYISYWKDIKKKCIEGMWGKDFDGYRYMTPNLYFYVNLCMILHTDKASKQRYKIRPQLSDLEWELSYMFLEAKGFSGWSEDETFTSSEYHKKCIENGWFTFDEVPRHEVTDIKGNYEAKYYEAVFTKDGKNLKAYVPPRENIRKLHDKPLGIPLYHNESSS